MHELEKEIRVGGWLGRDWAGRNSEHPMGYKSDRNTK